MVLVNPNPAVTKSSTKQVSERSSGAFRSSPPMSLHTQADILPLGYIRLRLVWLTSYISLPIVFFFRGTKALMSFDRLKIDQHMVFTAVFQNNEYSGRLPGIAIFAFQEELCSSSGITG